MEARTTFYFVPVFRIEFHTKKWEKVEKLNFCRWPFSLCYCLKMKLSLHWSQTRKYLGFEWRIECELPARFPTRPKVRFNGFCATGDVMLRNCLFLACFCHGTQKLRNKRRRLRSFVYFWGDCKRHRIFFINKQYLRKSGEVSLRSRPYPVAQHKRSHLMDPDAIAF